MILLGGCATQKKAEKYYKKHPVELAKECSEKFPVRDSLIAGDSIFVYDTLWGIETYTDTLISEPQVITEVKTVTVPKVITKTVTIRDTVIRENTAKTYYLNSKIANLSTDKAKLQVKLSDAIERIDKIRSKYNNTLSWLILCIVLLGIGTYLRIRKIL